MDTLPDPVVILLGFVLLIGLAYALLRPREASASYQKAARSSTSAASGVHLTLPGSGAEVFTPRPLEAGRVYQITVTGTYEYSWFDEWYGSEERVGRADAFYDTDTYGNFTIRYDGLRLDDQSLSDWPHVVVDAERGQHVYRFNVDGTGRILSVSVRPPRRSKPWGVGNGPKGLWLTIEALPPGSASPKVVAAARPTQSMARDAVITDTNGEDFSSKQKAAYKKRARELRLATEALRNWEDKEFRVAYARVHRRRLVTERDRILAARTELERQETSEFLQYLRDNNDRYDRDLLYRLTGEFEALLLAERQQLEDPPEQQLKKLSPEQYRERLLQRLRVAAEDTQAVTTTYHEQRRKFEERLRRAGISDKQINEELDKFEEQSLPFLERHDKKVNHASSIEVLK